MSAARSPSADGCPKRKTRSRWAKRIDSLLGSLPEQADVIRLHTFGSLHFTEIAEVLDCPVTTVKSRFRYG